MITADYNQVMPDIDQSCTFGSNLESLNCDLQHRALNLNTLQQIRNLNQQIWQELSIKETLALEDYLNLESGQGQNGISSIFGNLCVNHKNNIECIEDDQFSHHSTHSNHESSSEHLPDNNVLVESDIAQQKDDGQKILVNSIKQTLPSVFIESRTKDCKKQKSPESDQSVLLDSVQSKLIRKLFPSVQKEKVSVEQDNSLVERLSKLELENANLRSSMLKIKKERDDLNRKLLKMDQEVLQKKELLLQEANLMRNEQEQQMKKLKQDRIMWEKQKKSMILPTQKERREVELLKESMQQQQIEFKAKEKRMLMTQERLSRKVADLEKMNTDLKAENLGLETLRLKMISNAGQNFVKTPRKMNSSDVISFPKMAKVMPIFKTIQSSKSPAPLAERIKINSPKSDKIPKNTMDINSAKRELDQLAQKIGLSGTFKVFLW